MYVLSKKGLSERKYDNFFDLYLAREHLLGIMIHSRSCALTGKTSSQLSVARYQAPRQCGAYSAATRKRYQLSLSLAGSVSRVNSSIGINICYGKVNLLIHGRYLMCFFLYLRICSSCNLMKNI